ncbi:P-loop NTPase family protein [Vulcanisaeta sp. JCM 14467]
MLIVVTSGSKGGTGKSTVALGLSAILSLRGFSHELFDYSCSLGVCTGVYYYLNDFVDGINRLSRLVRVRQGLPPQGYEGLAIVDLPPMSLAQPEFVDLLGRADILVVVSSYEPDSVVSAERVLEAYPGGRVVRICNRMPTEDCKHYLKVTPESPFFVIGEPTNFRTFSELVSGLGFSGVERFERVGRQFVVGGVRAKIVTRWDPYAIIGIEVSGKWYYALMPFVRPIEDLVSMAHQMLGPTYLFKLGLADNALTRLLKAVRR